MIVPLWVAEAARLFWAETTAVEPFPRTLVQPLRRSSFPVTVESLPGLTLRQTEDYLARLGFAGVPRLPDRPLRACLAACQGATWILLDADDPLDERTFSLAHEIAHFLHHYWLPRRCACERLGLDVVDVLDGRRVATATERVAALLAAVPLDPHVHLMERGPRIKPIREDVARAEEEADRLAYELLAPAAAVHARLASLGEKDREAVSTLLRDAFGLPRAQAEEYARLLLPSSRRDPLLVRLRHWL